MVYDELPGFHNTNEIFEMDTSRCQKPSAFERRLSKGSEKKAGEPGLDFWPGIGKDAFLAYLSYLT